MSFDFTNRPELSSLALVVSALEGVAVPLGYDYCVIGATARDMMLHYAYGIDVSRATEDVDFSVMVRDWDAFTNLRDGLIGSGAFVKRSGVARDMRAMLEPEAVEIPQGILEPETDIDGAQLLAAQSGLAIPQAMQLIHALSVGLSESK